MWFRRGQTPLDREVTLRNYLKYVETKLLNPQNVNVRADGEKCTLTLEVRDTARWAEIQGQFRTIPPRLRALLGDRIKYSDLIYGITLEFTPHQVQKLQIWIESQAQMQLSR